MAATVKPPTIIPHSRAGETVPFADSEESAQEEGIARVGVGQSGDRAPQGRTHALQRIPCRPHSRRVHGSA